MKQIGMFLLGIFYIPMLLAADVTIIDSGLADYDGKVVTLTDHVKIEHELGTISADKIVMLPWTYNKILHYPLIQLRDAVAINLKDGGQLFCSNADIDYRRLHGYFFGNEDKEFVVYNETRKDKAGDDTTIIVKSRQMRVTFDREEEQGKGVIKEIVAEDKVTINYNRDYIATGDVATYRRYTPAVRGKGDKGTLTLQAAKTGGVCQVMNKSGDCIRGSQVLIDTQENLLTFDIPKGSLNSDKEQRLEFSAESLVWDHNNHSITLRENIRIKEGLSLIINNDEEVRIFNEQKEGKYAIKTIEASGYTNIEYDNEMAHTLTCDGEVTIDQDTLTIVVENIKPNSYVQFHDRYGQIYADKMTVYYTFINKQLTPKKILLDGNVSIINRFTGVIETGKTKLQYAIADKAVYFPENRLLKLISNTKKRVLLYDKINNLQVSAPQLDIYRNKKTKKDTMKGVGNVRFSFKEHEFEQLRKRVFMEGV